MSGYTRHLAGAPSGLTERERSLLCYLAIESVRHNYGVSEEEAADALDEAAGRNMVHLRGDQGRVMVTFETDRGALVLVDATRVALRRIAHPFGQLDN